MYYPKLRQTCLPSRSRSHSTHAPEYCPSPGQNPPICRKSSHKYWHSVHYTSQFFLKKPQKSIYTIPLHQRGREHPPGSSGRDLSPKPCPRQIFSGFLRNNSAYRFPETRKKAFLLSTVPDTDSGSANDDIPPPAYPLPPYLLPPSCARPHRRPRHLSPTSFPNFRQATYCQPRTIRAGSAVLSPNVSKSGPSLLPTHPHHPQAAFPYKNTAKIRML